MAAVSQNKSARFPTYRTIYEAVSIRFPFPWWKNSYEVHSITSVIDCRSRVLESIESEILTGESLFLLWRLHFVVMRDLGWKFAHLRRMWRGAPVPATARRTTGTGNTISASSRTCHRRSSVIRSSYVEENWIKENGGDALSPWNLLVVVDYTWNRKMSNPIKIKSYRIFKRGGW